MDVSMGVNEVMPRVLAIVLVQVERMAMLSSVITRWISFVPLD